MPDQPQASQSTSGETEHFPCGPPGGPEALVDSCLAGDRQAMAELYNRTVERVYGLMLRMVGPQDADDLTQQVFLRAFEKLAQFRGQAKFETWLYRLASNEALQHLRRHKQTATQPLILEPAEEPVDELLGEEEVQLLQAALTRIAPNLRAILSLKEERGLSYRQIAEVVGIPEGTVGSRLNRARKDLRAALSQPAS